MICPNCGMKIEPGITECPMCRYIFAESEGSVEKSRGGKKSDIPKTEEKQTKAESENITTEVKKKKSGSKKRGGIIAGLCAAGGVAALLIILFAVTGKNNNLTLEEQLESLQASQEAEKKDESEQSTSGSSAQTAPTQQQTTASTIGSSLEAQQTSMAQAATPVEVYAEPASIISKSGNIVADGQYDKYTFTAPYDGRYRVEMTGMPDGLKVDLDFNDSGGKLLESNYGIGNGDGVTVKDLIGGSTYEVVVSYNNGSTPYLLEVGLQKPALDISHATIAYDSIEYTDQRNLYNFIPSKTGDYRFELSDVMGGVLLDMFAFDDSGNKLGSKEGIGNGDGLTLKNLKAGEVYEIQVRQIKGLGYYSLLIK